MSKLLLHIYTPRTTLNLLFILPCTLLKYLTIRRYIISLFFFHTCNVIFVIKLKKKRSKSSEDNSTEPEALVIFNLGQSLGSQPGQGQCIVINYLKVKWKSNMLILYRYIYIIISSVWKFIDRYITINNIQHTDTCTQCTQLLVHQGVTSYTDAVVLKLVEMRVCVV